MKKLLWIVSAAALLVAAAGVLLYFFKYRPGACQEYEDEYCEEF